MRLLKTLQWLSITLNQFLPQPKRHSRLGRLLSLQLHLKTLTTLPSSFWTAFSCSIYLESSSPAPLKVDSSFSVLNINSTSSSFPWLMSQLPSAPYISPVSLMALFTTYYQPQARGSQEWQWLLVLYYHLLVCFLPQQLLALVPHLPQDCERDTADLDDLQIQALHLPQAKRGVILVVTKLLL